MGCLFHPQAREATRNALIGVNRTPNDTISAAASRLADAFHTSVVDGDGLHASETIFS